MVMLSMHDYHTTSSAFLWVDTWKNHGNIPLRRGMFPPRAKRDLVNLTRGGPFIVHVGLGSLCHIWHAEYAHVDVAR
jgi:hypothetical protein